MTLLALRRASLSPARQGHLAMLLFSALVAGSFSLGSLVANDIAPAAFNAMRFAIAAAIVGTVALATTGLSRQMWRAPWRYTVLGAVFASYFVLMFEGLKTAAPVSAAAVFTLTPVLSGVGGYILLRQITTPRMALALAIGAVGALWVIFRADWIAFKQFQIGRGELIYFVGCAAHAIYTPLVRLLNRGEAPVQFTFGMLLACVGVALIWGWQDLRTLDVTALPTRVWVALVYISVFASAVTFVLVQFSTLRLPAAKVMAYTYLVPSWVLLWEWVMGNGVPPLLILVGIGLTVAALLMLLQDEDHPSDASSPSST